MKEIKIQELMSKIGYYCAPETPISQVAETMVRKKLSSVVVGASQEPLGIITERDLVRLLLDCRRHPERYYMSAAEYMSSPIVTLNKNETLFDALVIARSEKVRHLPVVNDENHLVGLITQPDLANAHFHVIERQAETIQNAIAAKTGDLELANEELQALSMEDHLMEVGNRRAMEVDLLHTHAAASRYQRSYSLVLLDVDYFKKYNDFYGHTAGDEALKAIAHFLKTSIRESDRLYRYGGEELLLLLPETSFEQGLFLSERLVSGFADLRLTHAESPLGILTMSAGISGAGLGDSMPESYQTVIEEADKALYAAKDAGRNRAKMAA